MFGDTLIEWKFLNVPVGELHYTTTCNVIFIYSGMLICTLQMARVFDVQVIRTSVLLFHVRDSEMNISFLPNELFSLIFTSVMLVSIIVTNHFIIPLFPGLQMRLKIGLGVLFTALAPAAAMVFQFALVTFDIHPLIHLIWLILPTTFLGIGHMNINTAGT